MTQDQAILFALFGAVFGLLLWGRWRYDLVAFSALLAAVVLGVLPAKAAFEGFGNPATLVVALVLVVSAGLTRSGAVGLITRSFIDATRPLGAHIAIMGAVGGVLSAFMNNVAALALLMPVDIQAARKAGRAPGLSLMPLSFATILGGMATLIGTPPNIIIAGIRGEVTGTPYTMFDFAPVGGVVALVGLVFVALAGWRLLPRRIINARPEDSMVEITAYVAELTVPEGSRQIGRAVRELYDEAEKADVAILTLVRDGKRRFGRAASSVLRAGDTLVVEATPEALEEFRTALGLAPADAKREAILDAVGEGLEMIEVVVPEGARIAGHSAERLGLSWRHRTVLIGISRAGRRISKAVRRTLIRPGDILLLIAPSEAQGDVVDWLGCLPLGGRGQALSEPRKTWTAIGIFAAAVLAASLGLIYLPVALGLVAVAYVLFRIIPVTEIYDGIAWPVVVLIGSMIPLGGALQAQGGTELIANGLISLTHGLPAWAVLTVLMVVTMSLSDVLNNVATAIVAAPVGVRMAEALGASPDPFLMAVAVASSCAFLTPIGHKNNTLILGPGGYRFGDYWRMGLPLEILVITVAIPMILLVWPL